MRSIWALPRHYKASLLLALSLGVALFLLLLAIMGWRLHIIQQEAQRQLGLLQRYSRLLDEQPSQESYRDDVTHYHQRVAALSQVLSAESSLLSVLTGFEENRLPSVVFSQLQCSLKSSSCQTLFSSASFSDVSRMVQAYEASPYFSSATVVQKSASEESEGDIFYKVEFKF